MVRKSRVKIIKRVLMVAALLGALLIVDYLVLQPTQPTTMTTTVKKAPAAKKAKSRQSNFYRQIYPITGELTFVNYPENFAGLVATGDLTITGQVTALKSYVYQGSTVAAYTLATIKVQRILANSGSTKPKSIAVLFAGGNIRKNLLLSHVMMKDFISDEEKAAMNSTTLVTAKYSYCPLPQIDQKLAVIISREPAGTNGVEQSFYMPVFSGKSVFLKQANGHYARERIDQDVPLSNDDALMNQGMTELVNGGHQL